MILTTGVINVDFADVTSIFRQSESSDAILGIGESDTGSAVRAVRQAIESPLIEKSLAGARGVILNISGDECLSLFEVNEATQYIYENTHPDVNIIFGTVIEKGMGSKVRATIVATDFADSLIRKSPQLGNVEKKLGTVSLELPDFMGQQAPPALKFHASDGTVIPPFRPTGTKPEEKK